MQRTFIKSDAYAPIVELETLTFVIMPLIILFNQDFRRKGNITINQPPRKNDNVNSSKVNQASLIFWKHIPIMIDWFYNQPFL